MLNAITLQNRHREKRQFLTRVLVALLLMLMLFAVLSWRYFDLQITDHDTYRTQSERNRVQWQPIPPKRGLIYDRNGVLLAQNRPSYSLVLIKEQLNDNVDNVLSSLQQLVSLDEEQMTDFQQRLRRSRPFQEVPLKFNLNTEEIALISVNRHRLPGVDVTAELVRHYPQGELFAHTLGYVGRISEQDLLEIDAANYRGSYEIGKIGVEKHYEDILHGTVGYQNVETNAFGRVLRVLERHNPEPGQDITLHLDSHLQQVASDILEDKRGAIVAIDPKTGGVLALVSMPSFDANLFVTGISGENYRTLRNSPDLPLFNRALQGQYPPGSTIKPIFGLAGLHAGVITPEFSVRDPGWFRLPGGQRQYRDWNWKQGGHGHNVKLEQAIVESCDVYYYTLAHKLGIDRLHDFVVEFGLGVKTGIDSTHERSGLMPSREWKRRHLEQPWYPGDTISVGIGQGYMLATPLQLAATTATLANRGQRLAPRFRQRIGDEQQTPAVQPTVEVAERHWDEVIKGMRNVVHGARGTARAIGRGAAYQMAGKTGTAQVIGIAQGRRIRC